MSKSKNKKIIIRKAYCRECGKLISEKASSCPNCGANQYKTSDNKVDYTTTLLISIFLGWLGIDRFYMRQVLWGILKLVTLGGLGIWWIIDIILIATKNVNGVELE